MSHTLLDELNERLMAVHNPYEDYFWTSNMGDHSIDDAMVKAEGAVSAFRADRTLSARVDEALKGATGEMKEKLEHWAKFFSCYQVPAQFLSLRTKVAELEMEVARSRTSRVEGYTDPASGTFVKASSGKMAMMISTHDDEAIRKACWEAKEVLAVQNVSALVELVKLRNEYARALGYEPVCI